MNKLFESACNITATINIEPSTPVELSEGDVLTADMFSDADDASLADLISIVDNVTVEEVTGANSYKISASITDDVAAVSLYQWIYANTNVKTDEDMEQYVAPGLAALVNSEAGEAGEAAEDPDETTDYDSLADEADMYNESVSSKFAKYRKLYEAAHAELNEAEALNDDKDEDGGGDDDFSDIFGDTGSSDDGGDNADDNADDKGEDKGEDGEDNKDENSDEDSDNEDVPMTAVVLTVKKDDADKCKDEMVEAGIAEDDIEIIDSDDEDDENSKIKVDVNSVKELKDYLKGKGIDLEEKIGGEIVDDDEDSDSKDDDNKDDDSKEDDKEDKDGEGGEDDFADMDFGDLFGDDEESSDEK